jgi:hypothetical protein
LTKTNKVAKRELTKVVTEPPKLLIRLKKLSWQLALQQVKEMGV